jgi:aminoglycoside/choline kinase family phosphotransferase/dTDP-glucose pyrophosphorylase
MKALILAAGLGTRLLPHTNNLPKPLFPINGQPIIDITTRKLINAGVDGIVVNTHHLHHQIETFIQSGHYAIPVVTRHEKIILGTGGAIKNVADFLGNQPFLVINSDILTDIDITPVMAFHANHSYPVTMVMHDYPEFNNVWVDESGFVTHFAGSTPEHAADSFKSLKNLAFTGIHVLDPAVMEWIADNRFVSIIDVYRDMLQSGLQIKAYVAAGNCWRDMGKPDSFFEAACDVNGPLAFEKAFGAPPHMPLTRTRLSGDGSDRRWFRVGANAQTLIMADHGIRSGAEDQPAEVDAFIHIGAHLYRQGVPVPRIYHSDPFSGLVYLEDLGDIHLQAVIQGETDPLKITRYYQKVIDHLLSMSVNGGNSFNPAWTLQTPAYDKQLILDRECRYFVEALLNGYLGMRTEFDDLATAFNLLAEQALENGIMGFMHRDFQSRNIMVQKEQVYFIDFQGGRVGPLQYDLASLLTDPYVNLSPDIQDALLDYAMTNLARIKKIDRQQFLTSYHACAICRILQSLGAFGHLTKVRHKPFFEPFIPIALNNLRERLGLMEDPAFAPLSNTVTHATDLLHSNRKVSS